MLRNLVLGCAVILTVGGAMLIAVAGPAGLSTFLSGLVLLVGTLFERVRYKRLVGAPPDARFERTRERFLDDAAGAPVTVYFDPKSGERSYVRE